MDRELPSMAQTKIQQLIEAEQQAQFSLSSTQKEISAIDHALGMTPDPKREVYLKREKIFQENTLSHAQTKHRSISQLNNYVRQYLERLTAGCEVVQAKIPEVKLEPDEDYLAGVERVRGEIASLIEQRRRVERADVDLSEKKQKISAWVKKQKGRGNPYVRWEDGEPVVRFEARVEGAYSPVPDHLALCAWLHPKALETRLHELLESGPQPAFSLSTEDRANALAQLAKTTLQAERSEEAMIMAAADRNQVIIRRPTADPRAVLQIIVRSAEGKIARLKRESVA